jgi:hypothetical protein
MTLLQQRLVGGARRPAKLLYDLVVEQAGQNDRLAGFDIVGGVGLAGADRGMCRPRRRVA